MIFAEALVERRFFIPPVGVIVELKISGRAREGDLTAC
jgi:hypothetical protein